MRKRLVLVTGAPGAGKTKLARPLACALDFVLICEDDIKEPMFEALDGIPGDLAISHKIGAAAWEVIWSLARQAAGTQIRHTLG
jgi:predicted kinase